MRFRPLDFAAIAAAAAAIALSSLLAYSSRGAELEVVVSGGGGEWIYPIDQDRQIEVPGPLGSTRVEISGRKVRIEDSPCPNKTCVASGAVSEGGQWVACLPNRVFVRVEGRAAKGGVDAGAF